MSKQHNDAKKAKKSHDVPSGCRYRVSGVKFREQPKHVSEYVPISLSIAIETLSGTLQDLDFNLNDHSK